MSVESYHQDLPASQIPREEQLQRIKRCGRHLRKFMARYFCEPQTAQQYQQRESLMAQLDTFEDKCNRLSQLLRKREKVWQTLADEINLLYEDFGSLENKIHAYREHA